jgi:hypothetical protein
MISQKIQQRGLLLVVFCLLLMSANAQQILTLESAMEIARSNSPDIQRSLLNLERSQQSLKAQNAALKSNFSLNLTPISYSKSRVFDDLQSIWNTNTTTESFGTITVYQPVLPTDCNKSMINRLGWQKNISEIRNKNETQ